MDLKEKSETNSGPPPPRLDCKKCFDALWFCYTPLHQMESYYRYGEFDNCFGKWGALVDCLTLKTKRKAEVEEILIVREKAKPHIWTYRAVDEASEHWWRMYKHMAMMSPPLPGSAAPTRKSDGKSGALVDCLTLTKLKADVEEILIAREKPKPHIWTYRTVDEASENWWRMYKHIAMMSPPLPGSAAPTPKSDDS